VLLSEFSGRSTAIDEMARELIDDYQRRHRRPADPATLAKIRQQATLQTRPRKYTQPLADQAAGWRDRATTVIGRDAGDWVTGIDRDSASSLRRADDFDEADVAAMAVTVVDAVSSTRSTWSRWNLVAETMRQIGAAGWQTTAPCDLLELRNRIVADAERLSVSLSPGETCYLPDDLHDDHGRSPYLSDSPVYSSREVLDAEARLLDLAARTDGPLRTALTRWAPRLLLARTDVALRRRPGEPAGHAC
jgi:TrwC relaxase